MRGKRGSCGVSANDYGTVQLYTGAQINFGDLTTYLTHDENNQKLKLRSICIYTLEQIKVKVFQY
jgi:hypothetical protein